MMTDADAAECHCKHISGEEDFIWGVGDSLGEGKGGTAWADCHFLPWQEVETGGRSACVQRGFPLFFHHKGLVSMLLFFFLTKAVNVEDCSVRQGCRRHKRR